MPTIPAYNIYKSTNTYNTIQNTAVFFTPIEAPSSGVEMCIIIKNKFYTKLGFLSYLV